MSSEKIRILVVDDDDDIVHGTAHLLKRAGYATATASNGVEAMRTMPTFHPQLVLSDRDMPEMDGVELCRRIKADPALAGVFVVLISGAYTQTEEQAEGLESGADGYIPRPIANRELLARVESYARIYRLQMRLSQARKMASVGQLACGMGHEINNPIMGIINYAQLIKDRLRGKDGDVEEFAEEIVVEAERIAGIVRKLSAFATRDTAIRVFVPVADLIESALTPLRDALAHDRIALEVDLPDNLPAVACDREQIAQVLTSLLENARDALNEKYPGHDEEKKIRISARYMGSAGFTDLSRRSAAETEAQRLLASASVKPGLLALEPRLNTEHVLRLTIEDHGAGISRDVIDHIFEPFFTTRDKSIGAGSIGKGMGLFVSHATMQEHGGEIGVESEPGQWTRFHMDLPAAGEQDGEITRREAL